MASTWDHSVLSTIPVDLESSEGEEGRWGDGSDGSPSGPNPIALPRTKKITNYNESTGNKRKKPVFLNSQQYL